MAMKQSASVSAIPMHIRVCEAAGQLGLAGDGLDGLADDDADADTGADGGEAEGEGGELSDDVHCGVSFRGWVHEACRRAQCSSASASWM